MDTFDTNPELEDKVYNWLIHGGPSPLEFWPDIEAANDED